MKNRILLVLSFVAAFILAAPAIAAPPEGDVAATDGKEAEPEAKVEEKADEAKTEEKADAKVEEKADEAKTEAKADAKAVEPAPEIKTDEEALDVVSKLIDAAKSGKWGVVAAMAIMLVVYGLRRMNVLAKVPDKYLSLVAAGLSIAAYIAGSLMVEGAQIVDAILGGFTVGASAAGLWEMLFKHLLPTKKAA